MAEGIFTPDERKKLEAQARRRGFKTLREYVQALIKQDAEQHGATIETEGDNLDDPAEGFRVGWAQAMRGEVLTEEEFWKAVADDE